MLYKNFFSILLILFIAYHSKAQQKIVKLSAQIIDQKTQEPLIGALVNIKGSKQGTHADFNGNFLIPYSYSGEIKDTLVFSFIGYETIEIPVKSFLTNNWTFSTKSKGIVKTGNRIKRRKFRLGIFKKTWWRIKGIFD